MESITIEMITGAIYSLAGLSALIVVLTQIFKNWWNKTGKRWVSHLISFCTSIVCNGIVLGIGLIWKVGIYANFDVHGAYYWLTLVGCILGCTLIANGTYSYETVKKILEWLKLMPKEENKQLEK